MPSRSESDEYGRWDIRRLNPGPFWVWGLLILATCLALLAQERFGASGARLAGVGLAILLVWISVIDARRWIIPDPLSIALICSGLALAAIGALDITLRDAVIGGLAGYGILAGLAQGYKALTGREGMGRGDAKLLAACGAWLGWMSLPYMLMIASASGLAYVLVRRLILPGEKPESLVAFGPHIALGAWICWVCGRFFFH